MIELVLEADAPDAEAALATGQHWKIASFLRCATHGEGIIFVVSPETAERIRAKQISVPEHLERIRCAIQDLAQGFAAIHQVKVAISVLPPPQAGPPMSVTAAPPKALILMPPPFPLGPETN